MSAIKNSYVETDSGCYFLQIRNPDSQWGFYLCDEEQSWDGGFGVADSWECVDPANVPKSVRLELDWILKEAQKNE